MIFKIFVMEGFGGEAEGEAGREVEEGIDDELSHVLHQIQEREHGAHHLTILYMICIIYRM